MLMFRRAFEMPSIGVVYQQIDYAQPTFRVRVERSSGMTLDEAMLFPTVPWTGYGDRPRLDVVLQGEIRDSENGAQRWLRRGQFAIGRALDSLYQRVHPAPALVLSIEWNLGSIGTSAPTGLPAGTLAEADTARLQTEVLALVEATHASQRTSALSAIVSRLRSCGIPFDGWRARDLVTEVPSRLQSVATAIGQGLSNLGRRPSVGEVAAAAGVSARRMNELIVELSATYGMNGGDWRTLRDRWRFVAGALAMSHPLARTEDVARALGYGSPVAFCHANQAAGLPSPGQIRAALAALV